MPQTQPASMYFPTCSLFSAFLQSPLSNLIPSRQTSFVLACACFVLLCLPFGFDLAESARSQPSGSGGRSVRGPKPCSNYDGFVTDASPLFSPAPYFMPVLWKPRCCFFIPTDFLYSLGQCIWKQDAYCILSSRRQRWGGKTENSVRVHTAAILLFLYRIRVRRAGNPGNLVSSVWPVAVVSKSCSRKNNVKPVKHGQKKHYVLLYLLNFTHHIQFSTRYFVGVFF